MIASPVIAPREPDADESRRLPESIRRADAMTRNGWRNAALRHAMRRRADTGRHIANLDGDD